MHMVWSCLWECLQKSTENWDFSVMKSCSLSKKEEKWGAVSLSSTILALGTAFLWKGTARAAVMEEHRRIERRKGKDLLSGEAYYWSLDISTLSSLFYGQQKRRNGGNGDSGWKLRAVARHSQANWCCVLHTCIPVMHFAAAQTKDCMIR